MIWDEKTRRTASVGRRHEPAAGIYNAEQTVVGAVARSGYVFNRSREHIGTVGLDGRVMAPSGTIVGWSTPFGAVTNHHGFLLGRTLSDGTIVADGGRCVGYVSMMLEVSLQQLAGAALLLLPLDGAL